MILSPSLISVTKALNIQHVRCMAPWNKQQVQGHARAGGSRKQVAARTEKAIKEGQKQMAEALAKAQDAWADHALGDAACLTIKDTAATAMAEHAADARNQLKATAASAYRSSLGNNGTIKDRKKAHEAILKWRAALWLSLDPSYDLACFSAWDVLDTRFRHWEEVHTCLMVSFN